jgi:hypothetical protein
MRNLIYVLTNTLGLIIALATSVGTGAVLETIFVTLSYGHVFWPKFQVSPASSGPGEDRRYARRPRARSMFEGERSMFKSERSMLEGERSMLEGERPMFESERPMFESERSMFESERSMFESERPMFESERPMFESERSSSEGARECARAIAES